MFGLSLATVLVASASRKPAAMIRLAFLRSRPSFCDWLKERSLNLPMSLISATSLSEFAPVVAVVVPLLLLLLPPQPAANTSTTATPSAYAVLRMATPTPDVLPNDDGPRRARRHTSKRSASYDSFVGTCSFFLMMLVL